MNIDWIECEMALCISANRDNGSWSRHAEALRILHQDESRAFHLLLANSHTSDYYKEMLYNCRGSNAHKFWNLAVKHWSQDGPQPDQCHNIDRTDAVYYW